jgi:hypothetical protein
MKHKEILLLLSSVLIIIIAWAGFSIYHNLATSTTPENLEKVASPIKPLFDEQTINKLKERKLVSPLNEFDRPTPTPTPTIPIPTPTFSPTPIASPSQILEDLTGTPTPGEEINP